MLRLTGAGGGVQPPSSCHHAEVQFLSDEWLAALDAAARSRIVPADDPLGEVSLVIDQVVRDGPTWRLSIDRGSLSVSAPGDGREPDIRLTSDRHTAAAIASGRRAALDAFIAGDLVIGGDIRSMLDHREALEALGDLFGQLRDATTFE